MEKIKDKTESPEFSYLQKRATEFVATRDVQTIFSDAEINQIYPFYRAAFPLKEDFKRAKFFQLWGVNIFKAVVGSTNPSKNLFNGELARRQLELAFDKENETVSQSPTIIIASELADKNAD
jgi:hypothetical protein